MHESFAMDSFCVASETRETGTPTRDQIVAHLEQHRCDLVGQHGTDTFNDKTEAHCRFYHWPDHVARQYVSHRDTSPLGQVFRIANGLSDYVDAVVVLGTEAWTSGCRAFVHASCDPYHNELTRADRGSRPRIYFAGDCIDNDALQALIARLAVTDDELTPAEKRFAIILVSDGEDSEAPLIACNQLAVILQNQLPRSTHEWLSRLIIPISPNQDWLDQVASTYGCRDSLLIPSGMNGHQAALTAATHLPAAFLGLDCMKLMEGAIATNLRFETSTFDDNPVIQLVMENVLVGTGSQHTRRVLHPGCDALYPMATWYRQTRAANLDALEGVAPPMTVMSTSQLNSLAERSCAYLDGTVVHHFLVGQCRADAIHANESTTLPQFHAAKTERLVAKLAQRQIPTNTITLPQIDAYSLGQLFQMLLIASELEARLTRFCKAAS